MATNNLNTTIMSLEVLITMIKEKDRKRILASDKEYCYLSLHTFNVGSYLTVKLSENYKEVEYPTFILSTQEVAEMLNKE